jgi:hypothetical protein
VYWRWGLYPLWNLSHPVVAVYWRWGLCCLWNLSSQTI